MVRFGLPMLGGLAEALARPGARMLDVGTGVAAMAVAYAELFPELTVVGLDVLPRALALAAATVAASGVADRVVLREQDVTTLDDEQAQRLLREAGLQDVTTAPTPPGAPAITVGRKAS